MGSTPNFQSESFEPTELDYYVVNSNVEVKQDFNSLFGVVHDVLQDSIAVAEKCLLGKNVTINLEVNPAPSINCSLNILRKIYCTVACEENSKPAAISDSIAKILSQYSWVERAVLTLAAFALSYGELLFYTDRDDLKRFPFLISSLRRVDKLINVKGQGQFHVAINNLNGLTKLTLKVVDFILQLDTLSKTDYKDDLSVVTEIEGHVELYSSHAINAVVACMAQVNYLTYDRIATTKVISRHSSELTDELTKLEVTFADYKLRIEERKALEKLQISFSSRKGIIEAFTCLLYPQSPDLEYKKTRVGVNELEGKNVLLFISKTDIFEDDFGILKRIHDGLGRKHDNYKIVWIPVVDKWGVKEIKEFATWKERMPWYVVCFDEKSTVGIKYIKNIWKFSYKSMVVVLNSQGVIECDDAMPIIRAWGIEAIPFKKTNKPDPCIRPLIVSINDYNQIEKEKHIFVYGGKEEKWINDFSKKVAEVTSHVSSKVSIHSFHIGLQNSKMETGHFWSRVDSLLYARTQWGLVDDGATKHIQNLLSFREEAGWAMLCKGSSILVCGSGKYILEAVAKYKDWTKDVIEKNKEFGICLKESYDAHRKTDPLPCRHVSIQSGANGWLPEHIICQDCDARMERVVTYKCCHEKNAMKNGSV